MSFNTKMSFSILPFQCFPWHQIYLDNISFPYPHDPLYFSGINFKILNNKYCGREIGLGKKTNEIPPHVEKRF